MEHLRNHPNNHPKSRKALTAYLSGNFGKTTEAEVLEVIENLCSAGNLQIDEKGKVTYTSTTGE